MLLNTWLPRQPGDELVQSLDPSRGQAAVEAHQLLADRRHQARRLDVGVQREDHAARRQLRKRQVDRRFGTVAIGAEESVQHVADDADDLPRCTLELEPSPDRFAGRPVSSGQGPIDDQHPGAVGTVGVGEQPPLEQRDAQGLEIAR